MTISPAQLKSSSRYLVFIKSTADHSRKIDLFFEFLIYFHYEQLLQLGAPLLGLANFYILISFLTLTCLLSYMQPVNESRGSFDAR